MYYFAKKWEILSTFSCFAMEGSQRRLKRMLRNNGGLSLLRGRLGVKVVVDNHTIDDSLWSTKRAQNGQWPMSVQMYASRTRRRLLTEIQHLQTLQRRSGVARKGHEITTRTQTIVAVDRGACRGALESLPGVLGQIRGCTAVTFV